MSRMDYECTGELREFNSPAMRVNSQLVWDSYLLRLYKLLVSGLYFVGPHNVHHWVTSNCATHLKSFFFLFN